MRPRRSYGFRGWAGKPSHPPLTALPLGGYVFAAAFEVVSLLHPAWARDAATAAGWVQAGAFLTSLATAATGFLDWRATDDGTQARRTVNTHALIMIGATLLAATSLGFRFWGADPTLIAVLTIVVAGVVLAGAWVGNDLVYEMGFRVEPAGHTPHWDRHARDVLPGGGRNLYLWPIVEGGDGEDTPVAERATINHH